MLLRIIITSILFTSLGSCSFIMYKAYGVRTLRKFDRNACEKAVASIDTKGIEVKQFYADTAAYKCTRRMPVSKKVRKDFSQPVQILYFRHDTLVSYHANCYAQGKPTQLNWNYAGRFEQFVPKSAIKLDSVPLQLSKFLNCNSNPLIVPKKKYTVVIYWTTMTEKISKDAIETVIDNINRFKANSESQILLINNDQAFVEAKK